MIRHISIDATNPSHIASVLAELFQGRAVPFHPVQGAYMVWFDDDSGSGIEVYPAGVTISPGTSHNPLQFLQSSASVSSTATHAAISIERDIESVLRIAQRENWRALEISRGPFSVIEFWVENRILFELLSPEMTEAYMRFAGGAIDS